MEITRQEMIKTMLDKKDLRPFEFIDVNCLGKMWEEDSYFQNYFNNYSEYDETLVSKFTNGHCIRFAKLMVEIFEGNTKVYEVGHHFITQIGDELFDIRGAIGQINPENPEEIIYKNLEGENVIFNDSKYVISGTKEDQLGILNDKKEYYTNDSFMDNVEDDMLRFGSEAMDRKIEQYSSIYDVTVTKSNTR